MNISYLYSLIAVIVLALFAYVGSMIVGGKALFGLIFPLLAGLTFTAGFIYRIVDWARSPVPFRIPTTCGQQKSLPWIESARIENPTTTAGVVVRMILEVVLFRSLFRNTTCEIREGDKLAYRWEIWLWAGSLAFHWAFFTVVVRHLRFFMEPVPVWLRVLEKLDGFLQIGLPGLLLSGVVLLAAGCGNPKGYRRTRPVYDAIDKACNESDTGQKRNDKPEKSLTPSELRAHVGKQSKYDNRYEGIQVTDIHSTITSL